jgi:predicted metal-dependent enzyme (double-stranded beta helix superfamily)
MFDVDELVAACQEAVREAQPQLAVRDVLERTVREPAAVLRALPAERAAVVPLHASPELTVLHVVWAPGMRIRPHDHLMWAAIGLYAGQEDNSFYRRSGQHMVAAGGKQNAWATWLCSATTSCTRSPIRCGSARPRSTSTAAT